MWPSSPPPPIGSARILVVDDLAENRRALERCLRRAGHQADTAASGEAALAWLERAKSTDPAGVDLVLLDVEMPGISGVEVLRRVKCDHALEHIPVVMVSGVDELRIMTQCIEMGADDFLQKPFEPLLLEARVRSSLERKRLRDWELSYLRQLQQQEAQSEELISSILPEAIARRLKRGDRLIADQFDDVSVLFADIVGFTSRAKATSPEELVAELNAIFSSIDELAALLGVEKIKTIGDAYMAVGGLPMPLDDHLDATSELALRLLADVCPAHGIALRIGIHCGPVVAGVIGAAKPSYDVWGDTVNIAHRMESAGVPAKIQVTCEVERRLRGRYLFESRGTVEVRSHGHMETYFLVGRR